MFKKIEALLSPRRGRRRAFDELISAGRTSIGRHSYAIPTVRVFDFDNTSLSIGSFSSIGPEVTVLLGGNHPTDRVSMFPLRSKLGIAGAGEDDFPNSKGDVSIGNDVWIGFGSTILSGVTIHDGAVVAAGSMVTRDVAPYTIVGGSPARYIRSRFDDATILKLQRLAWWDWPDERIIENVAALNDLHAHIGLAKLSED